MMSRTLLTVLYSIPIVIATLIKVKFLTFIVNVKYNGSEISDVTMKICCGKWNRSVMETDGLVD